MRGSWRPNKDYNILTPQFFWLRQPFFPVLLGCPTGGLGAQPLLGHGSHSSIFSPTDLKFLSPGLYNNLTYTYFLRASQFGTQFNAWTVNVAPDLLISSTGCTCYLHWCISSFDSLAGSEVNMQHFSLLSYHLIFSIDSLNTSPSTLCSTHKIFWQILSLASHDSVGKLEFRHFTLWELLLPYEAAEDENVALFHHF